MNILNKAIYSIIIIGYLVTDVACYTKKLFSEGIPTNNRKTPHSSSAQLHDDIELYGPT